MSFSDALDLARTGRKDAAALLLKEEFGRLQSPQQRVDLCRWIASCFEGLEDYQSAAEWYEMTGLLTLGETTCDAANALRALPDYQKAREYYEICSEEERAQLCSRMISQLSGCFVAS